MSTKTTYWTCVIASRDNVNVTMPSGWEAIDSGTNNKNGLEDLGLLAPGRPGRN